MDPFVEDAEHEELLKPLLARLGQEEGAAIRTQVRSARGGHPRALREFRLYQRTVVMTAGEHSADLVVVAIDANCSSLAEARKRILDSTEPGFRERLVTACPDPHIERWYMADLNSFKATVGRGPAVLQHKCARGHYKTTLQAAIRESGHPDSEATAFARELARDMDLYRAGRNDPSLKAFLDERRAAFRRRVRTPGPIPTKDRNP